MPDLRDASSHLLTQLLSANYPEPELGARLKQRLNAAFVSNGLGSFDEKALGFPKFTDYLQRVHGDLVSIERREGLGDILVSLRAASFGRFPAAPIAPTPNQPKASNAPVIRSAVWQAFANPDPDRKRFFNKHSGKVVHYLVDRDSRERAEVEASRDSFLEITPIAGEL